MKSRKNNRYVSIFSICTDIQKRLIVLPLDFPFYPNLNVFGYIDINTVDT